jgi:hypothetical protein
MPAEGQEIRGVVVNSVGGSIASVQLPRGATVTRFRYAFRDSEAAINTHAYLLRTRLEPGDGIGAGDGYGVMAAVHSEGASPLLRRPSDGTIAAAVVNNERYAYFVEIVNCAPAIEPVGVQIVYIR